MRARLLAVLCVAPLAARAQGVSPCALVTAPEIAATSAVAVGRLTRDDAVTLPAKQVPGLASDLRVEQCHGEIRASGAVTLRINLLTATRDLTAAEWQRTEAALDALEDDGPAPAPQRIAGAACAQHSWTTRRTLHGHVCSRAAGKHLVAIEWEHEDAAQLPALPKVAALLARAVTALAGR
ncbi:MAG: hypothetical protein MUF21_01425 [Gemmatimonadaceae bacterium]|jgi:hypothetical protein|nr:hypothetical protein [Gemmatimonadaceae bacterium]